VDGNQGENLAISTGTKAVSYTPKFAYAANQGSDNISEYAINGASGALTAISGSPLADKNGPDLIMATPSGAFVYTGNANHSISEYSVNASTGALSLVGGSPINGFGSVNGLAMDPANGYLLVLDSTKQELSSYTINSSTGALTLLSSSAVPTTTAQAVALDPTGTIAIVTSLTEVDYYAVDNGFLAPLKSQSGSNFPIAVSTDQGSQYVFVAEKTGNAVATYAMPFGGLLSSATTGNNPRAVAAEPSGKFVYVANSGDGTISVYSLNIATGALTEVGTAVPAGAGTNALTTSNDGKYLYATNNTAGTVSGFAINVNGSLTSLGTAIAGSFPTSLVTTGGNR
jgi:6-phosphogluconolactonase (cycloisomerase 2 family)